MSRFRLSAISPLTAKKTIVSYARDSVISANLYDGIIQRNNERNAIILVTIFAFSCSCRPNGRKAIGARFESYETVTKQKR